MHYNAQKSINTCIILPCLCKITGTTPGPWAAEEPVTLSDRILIMQARMAFVNYCGIIAQPATGLARPHTKGRFLIVQSIKNEKHF